MPADPVVALLPCPFCGGVGDIESQPSYSQAANTHERHRGWCDTCCFGLDWHGYEPDAITAWNTRTHAPAGDVREADEEDAKLLADANSWYSQAQIEEESWQVAERLLAKEEGLDPSHHVGAANRLLDKQTVTKIGALSAIEKALASPTPDTSAVSGSAEVLREAASTLRSAVRRILARCEAIEDENSDQLGKDQTEASSGFLRGERSLAKSIRRELHDLTRAHLTEGQQS